MTDVRLALRVAVTGHRPGPARTVDPAVIRPAAARLLRGMAAAAAALHADLIAARTPLVSAEPPDLRLAAAIAEGADTIVADAALEAGFALDLVLPFPAEDYARDFDGPALADFRRLHDHPRAGSRLVMDLPTGGERAVAYQRAGVQLLALSDVLLTVLDEDWPGEAEGAPRPLTPARRTTGGTADVTDAARRLGLLVVRIDLRGEAALWSPADGAPDPAADGTWTPLGEDPGPLKERLRALLAPPADARWRPSRRRRASRRPTPPRRSTAASPPPTRRPGATLRAIASPTGRTSCWRRWWCRWRCRATPARRSP